MKIGRIAAILMAGALLIPTACAFPSAAEELQDEQAVSEESSLSDGITYSQYLDKYSNNQTHSLDQQITIAANTYQKEESVSVTDRLNEENGIELDGQSSIVSWNVNIPVDGLYCMQMRYKAAQSGKNDIKLAVLLDGELPFREAEEIQLSRLWKDATEIKQDENGNDIRPQAEEMLVWQTYDVQDSEGSYSDSFHFYLTAGIHKLSLKSISQGVILSQIILSSPKKLLSYEEYLQTNQQYPRYQGEALTVEAEKTCYRSSASEIAINDMSSALTTPCDAYKIRLNSFGGNNWKYVGDRAYWSITVPETAWYKIAVRFRQNYYNGMQTHRKLTVNGEVPFAEAGDLKFDYDTSWQSKTLGEYEILLKKGENIIGMEAVLGDYVDILRTLDETVLNLNTIYRKIIMITGTVPDSNRDYELDKEIPGLIDDLKSNDQVICKLISQIEKLSGKHGSETSQLTEISRQLEDMIAKPYTITRSGRLDRFKSNITALGAWQTRLRDQPLELDSITILPENGKALAGKDGFLQSVVHKSKRFIASFVVDYSVLGSSKKEKSIRVWVQTGRDQAQILKNMCDDTFTPGTNISVQIELVQGGIIEAILAGKGPDVALGRGDVDPVNFAMRGALYDLSNFSDFAELKSNFIDSALKPYQYKGGCYGLPERQTFDMMFYRKDIFEELHIAVPTTWDELFSKVLPVIQRNNMVFGVGNLNKMADMTNSNIFTTLLYQMGGSLYSDDLQQASLDEQAAYQAFKMAVELYRDYKLPREYDFLNRFRTGEMPLAFAPYTMYNSLAIGAPEINGLWEMVPILGTVQQDGTINNTQVVNSTAAIMYSKTKDPDSAWKFIKWWVSGDAQARFGNEQEAVLGPSGRYDTANKNALKLIAWEPKQLMMLEKQRDRSTTVAQIPGSYFMSRAINNSFVSSVTDYKIPREELLYWNEQINIELARKRLEFTSDTAGGGS